MASKRGAASNFTVLYQCYGLGPLTPAVRRIEGPPGI